MRTLCWWWRRMLRTLLQIQNNISEPFSGTQPSLEMETNVRVRQSNKNPAGLTRAHKMKDCLSPRGLTGGKWEKKGEKNIQLYTYCTIYITYLAREIGYFVRFFVVRQPLFTYCSPTPVISAWKIIPSNKGSKKKQIR